MTYSLLFQCCFIIGLAPFWTRTAAKLPLMLFRDNNSLRKAHVIVCELTLQMGTQCFSRYFWQSHPNFEQTLYPSLNYYTMRGKMESENNHLHLKTTTTMFVLCLGHDQRFTRIWSISISYAIWVSPKEFYVPKGQLISECPFAVLNFPKRQVKNLTNSCPRI